MAALAQVASATPAMDVTVSKDDKTAFKGTTSAKGTFSTGKLEPGTYVVQFNARNAASVKGQQFAVVVSAGKKKVTADSVAGAKFVGGGIAMKVDVGNGLNITGQVASGSEAVAQSGSSGSAKVRIINGERYVWVGPETGSNIGGRWVEEGSIRHSRVKRGEGLEAAQDRAARESLGAFGGGG